jgi:peptidoglycan/xylan/chitin deacetylase (PgdA/CDA1 family)
MLRRAAKRLVSLALRPLPLVVVRVITGLDLTVACYHAVTDEPPAHLKHVVPCRSVATFQRDLNFLLRHFRPVALSDVLEHVRSNRPLPSSALLFTFDDGLREFQDFIAPICLQMGIPATLFLTTDALLQKQLLYRHKASLLADQLAARFQERASPRGAATQLVPDDILSLDYTQSRLLDTIAEELDVDFHAYLHNTRPYLNVEHVQDLIHRGFTVGAHSIDHPPYAVLPIEEQLRQTRESVATVHDLFSINYKVFAFPFTSDGVPAEFYDRVFADSTADLMFCLGRIASRDSRNIPRVWLDASSDRSVDTMLRDSYVPALRSTLHNWLR